MARGTFLALEGLDGSGTSTQATRLGAALARRGHRVLTTHQPSSRAIGRQIRALLQQTEDPPEPKTLALLFAADRLDHVRGEIEPALQRGEVVLCDRYVVSSWVYQSLDCNADWVEAINRFAPWPDATFLLSVDPDVATARVRARTPEDDREIFETAPTQRRVARAYADVLTRDLPNLVSIDGTRPTESVTHDILDHCIRLGL